jgi:hypothetical protein
MLRTSHICPHMSQLQTCQVQSGFWSSGVRPPQPHLLRLLHPGSGAHLKQCYQAIRSSSQSRIANKNLNNQTWTISWTDFSCFLFHSTLEFYFGDVHFLFPITKASRGMIIPTMAPSTGSWLGMYRVISQLQMELVHLTKQTYSTFTKLVFLKLHPCETPSVASQGFFTQKCQLGTLNTSHPVVFLGGRWFTNRVAVKVYGLKKLADKTC